MLAAVQPPKASGGKDAKTKGTATNSAAKGRGKGSKAKAKGKGKKGYAPIGAPPKGGKLAGGKR